MKRPAVDLSTTYLGLRLRSPIVASAGPLTGDPGSLGGIGGCRCRRDRAAVAVRGADRARGVRHRGDARHSALMRSAEALNYLPELDDYDDSAGLALGLVEAGPGPSVDPGDRQPQRHIAGRVGALRPLASRAPAPTRSS